MTTSPPSRSLKWPIILNYAIAVVFAAISVVVVFALYPLWGADAAPLLFLCVVMVVAMAAGPGPAALASVLTFLSLQYPLLSSGYPFVLESGEILRLGLFIVASVFVLMLSAARKRTSASLQLLGNNQQIMMVNRSSRNFAFEEPMANTAGSLHDVCRYAGTVRLSPGTQQPTTSKIVNRPNAS